MTASPSLADPHHGQISSRTRERLGRALDTSLTTGTAFAVALVAFGSMAAWLGTYLAGGTRSVLPHAFYLPIIFAASRFRWPGAIISAVAAGILAGPLMPLDVHVGTAQSPAAWAGRLAAFVTIALVVAWLSGESTGSILAFARDARGARDLRRALARGELEAHYQPIIDLKTGHTTGFEALCRWKDPVRGLVPPSEFIPLAERTEAIIPIGVFMLQQAAHQGAAWHAAGAHDLVVAVNVSANQLCHPDFTTHVCTAVRDAGLNPQHLCIEITETAIIRDRHTALAHVTTLHDLGVLISLDDFGTGQASLAYLQAFPIDIVKIDLSFVSTVDTDPPSAALVAGIIALARALGASTVAEGIERRTQLETLRTLGCDQGQGYYLGHPGPPLQARMR
jgi:EAL domain-containing protein (putative c-di-GMP-specific phosphodiesterase class I)